MEIFAIIGVLIAIGVFLAPRNSNSDPTWQCAACRYGSCAVHHPKK